MKPKTLNQAILQEEERQQHIEALGRLSEELHNSGASQQSIDNALRAYNKKLQATSKFQDPQQSYLESITPSSLNQASGTLLSLIPTQQTEWLWQQRIPLGHLTLLQGQPGIGTSLLATTIAALVTTGQPMPGDTSAKPGNVILITPHDNPGSTIKPRLQAAGGDPSHILLLMSVEHIDTKNGKLDYRPFSFPDDIGSLETNITRAKATLVIIDPFTAALTHHSSASRHTVLSSLAHLAQRTNCAILLIHPLNNGRASTLHTVSTCPLDLISAVSSQLLIIHDPNDEQQRLLITTKHSLGPQPSTLAYDIIPHNQDQSIPTILWLGEHNYPTSISLSTGTLLSARRQLILDILHKSNAPLDARTLTKESLQDYESIRKMLQRMHHAGELVSPSRGLYTTPGHLCLTQHTLDTNTIPPNTPVPTVPMVSSSSDTNAVLPDPPCPNCPNCPKPFY